MSAPLSRAAPRRAGAGIAVTGLLRGLAHGSLVVAGAAMFAMTVVVAWTVFGRFVLNDTPVWGEQTALVLMGWAILGAAAAGVREGTHMGFDTLREMLPEGPRRWTGVVADTAVMLVGGALAWWGTELAAGVWDDTLPTIGLPSGVRFVPLVLGGALIAIFAAERVALRLAGHRPPEAGLPEA